jgi:hypothetical protein
MRTQTNRGTQHRRTRRAPHGAIAPGWPPRRLYAGRRNALALARTAAPARPRAARGRLEPWLGGAAMVASAASWCLLLALLGG